VLYYGRVVEEQSVVVTFHLVRMRCCGYRTWRGPNGVQVRGSVHHDLIHTAAHAWVRLTGTREQRCEFTTHSTSSVKGFTDCCVQQNAVPVGSKASCTTNNLIYYKLIC
jgi:hypothetical protein